jgi:HTH-type transcriptional regulator/antitoxin HigA
MTTSHTHSLDPDWIGQEHPGALLKEELVERGMSQADLARATGLTQKHISMIVTGKCGIGLTAATAFEHALGISARLWIRLQADYDVTHQRRML